MGAGRHWGSNGAACGVADAAAQSRRSRCPGRWSCSRSAAATPTRAHFPHKLWSPRGLPNPPTHQPALRSLHAASALIALVVSEPDGYGSPTEAIKRK
jgi:hypothetical protein